jgi:hypothetical protein
VGGKEDWGEGWGSAKGKGDEGCDVVTTVAEPIVISGVEEEAVGGGCGVSKGAKVRKPEIVARAVGY